MKSKELLIIIEEEREFYHEALECCDEPEFSHYLKMHASLSHLMITIQRLHKECGS